MIITDADIAHCKTRMTGFPDACDDCNFNFLDCFMPVLEDTCFDIWQHVDFKKPIPSKHTYIKDGVK